MTTKDFSKLAAVVMASGLSRRFGSNKLLTALESKPLLKYALDALRNAGLKQLVVVTRSSQVKEFAQQQGIAVILHELPYQSDTVALGVQHWLNSKLELQGILFATGDQPLVNPATITKLCQEFLAKYQAKPSSLIYRLASCDKNTITPGNPVIFSQELIPELLQLPQDKGGSALCKKHPELVHHIITDAEELLDIDTPTELQLVKELLQKQK